MFWVHGSKTASVLSFWLALDGGGSLLSLTPYSNDGRRDIRRSTIDSDCTNDAFSGTGSLSPGLLCATSNKNMRLAFVGVRVGGDVIAQRV
eukprot:7376609-Prymnesium_polylepis.1